MPPRFAYWTIILEGKPTAFRAQHEEELLPTVKQLQSRHPDAVLKWFARGRLWESPQEAIAAQKRGGERRPSEWRPGGEHRDPRARFKVPRDEKRRRFAAKLRRDGLDRSERQTPEPGSRPESTAPVPRRDREPDKRDHREHRGPARDRQPAQQREDRDKKPPRPPGAGARSSFRPKSGGPGRRFGPKPGGRGPGKGGGGPGKGGGGRSR